MRVGLVRVDADARPDVGLALGDGDDVAPLALARRDVEEAGDAAFARVFKHFVLAFDQAFVIEVAVAVDQPHAASSSSGSSSRGNSGVRLREPEIAFGKRRIPMAEDAVEGPQLGRDAHGIEQPVGARRDDRADRRPRARRCRCTASRAPSPCARDRSCAAPRAPARRYRRCRRTPPGSSSRSPARRRTPHKPRASSSPTALQTMSNKALSASLWPWISGSPPPQLRTI